MFVDTKLMNTLNSTYNLTEIGPSYVIFYITFFLGIYISAFILLFALKPSWVLAKDSKKDSKKVNIAKIAGYSAIAAVVGSLIWQLISTIKLF